MATNPMQKKARNAFLLGIVVMLVISLVIGALLWIFVLQDKTTKNKDGELIAYVYKLKQDVEMGEVIDGSKVVEVVTTTASTPTDAIASKKQLSDGKLQSVGFSGTYISKTSLTKGTILSQSMIYEGEEKLANDLRLAEFNMFTLPIDLQIGDYIDVRMTTPSGQDYIVVSKKQIMDINGSTLSMNLTEDEILTINGAIVERYIMKAANIYAIKYIDETQSKAVPTYPVNPEVAKLIDKDPNIVNTAKQDFISRYNNSLDLRNNVQNQVNQYSDNSLSNVEQGIKDQIENARQQREQYLNGM